MKDKGPSPSALPPLSSAHQQLIDQLIAGYQKQADIIGENGLLKQITKVVFEAALKAEMAVHFGHDKHAPVANATGNVRNGQSVKTVTGDFGEVEITAPRDRDASFTPQLIAKHQRHFLGIDDRILSLHARGMTTREIATDFSEPVVTDILRTYRQIDLESQAHHRRKRGSLRFRAR